jgi:hypothetical protein
MQITSSPFPINRRYRQFQLSITPSSRHRLLHSCSSLFSLGLLRGRGHHPLGEMCVFGIQHAQMILPMLHMDFIPRLTQKRDDLVFLVIMKF